MIHTGFTGTQRGLTPMQKKALWGALKVLTGWLHHGDCVGADADAHALARFCGLKIAIHPPSNPSKRAWCDGDLMFPPTPYLVRNHSIVDCSSSLIATPKEMVEERRSGTWSTVRFARKMGIPITLIMPDGSVCRGDVVQLTLR